jgi:hypothetical protein
MTTTAPRLRRIIQALEASRPPAPWARALATGGGKGAGGSATCWGGCKGAAGSPCCGGRGGEGRSRTSASVAGQRPVPSGDPSKPTVLAARVIVRRAARARANASS